MHVLDDLAGFSGGAVDLLTRTGRREPVAAVRTPTDFLFESHAVMDMVSSWDPWPGNLEAWVSSDAGVVPADRIEGLTVVAEASGRYDRWPLSDHVAVRSFWSWTSRRPRAHAVQMWTRGGEGRKQAQAAFRNL